MSNIWTIFANLNSISTLFLDGNFGILAQQSATPCSVTGTNALVLTPLANTPPISAYSNYEQFSGVIAIDNTGPATAQVGALANLPIFKDTSAGPVALTGAEMQAGNLAVLTYDSALSAGGGFHLTSGPAAFSAAYLPLAGGVMSGGISGLTSLSMSGALTGATSIGTGGLGAASITSTLISATSIGATTLGVTDLLVGAGPRITRVLSALASVAFTTIVPGGSQVQPVSLTGVQPNDNILVGLPIPTAGVVFDGYCSVANVALIRATNATAGTINPGGATYRATGVGFT